jgi:hypothetical protein
MKVRGTGLHALKDVMARMNDFLPEGDEEHEEQEEAKGKKRVLSWLAIKGSAGR